MGKLTICCVSDIYLFIFYVYMTVIYVFECIIVVMLVATYDHACQIIGVAIQHKKLGP